MGPTRLKIKHLVPGFSIHDELRELVDAGLTPFEALQTGTSNAAQVLNGLNQSGTVAVGRQADLILLESNPLENISNVARTAAVMVRGRWLSRAEIQTRLNELAASYSKK